MKNLRQTLCGALMILPAMLWAQEDADKTEDQEVLIEWIIEEDMPEGLDEKIQAIIQEELKKVSKEGNGIKIMMIDEADIQMETDGAVHSEMVKIISEVDENGNTVLTKYLNGKEVPIDETDGIFKMSDWESLEEEFPAKMDEIHALEKIIESEELDFRGLEEKLSKLEIELDGENAFFQDVNIVKEVDEDGVEHIRTFVNGEEVENADFPIMNLDFQDEKLFPDGDVKVYMIRQEIVFDKITEEDETPKNLKTSKEPLELEDLNMFPNPNNGIFTLKLQAESDAKVTLRILNVEGKTIYNEKLKPSGGLCTQEIDISGEGKGIYFLNIEQKGKYLSRKIVVQ